MAKPKIIQDILDLVAGKTDKVSTYTMLYDGGATTDYDISAFITGFKYIHLFGHWSGTFVNGVTIPVSYITANYNRTYTVMAMSTLTQYAIISVKFTSASHIQVTITNIGGFIGGLHLLGSN